MKTAILCLPQGSGKSLFAHQLAQHLGCKWIVDEWCTAMPVVRGALHLTNSEVA